MDKATSAMENVPLTGTPPVTPTPPDIASDTASNIGSVISDETPRALRPFIKRVHGFFNGFCHLLGAFFLRFLSTIMLLTGIVVGVIVQMLAFYYTGVLNYNVIVATAFYAPALVAMALIRAEMLVNGTSRSGAGPRMTPLVSIAYLLITLFSICSLVQPLALRADAVISSRSMWQSIAGTAFFYYCLLISEILFAAAYNVRKAKEADLEAKRREGMDPAWVAQYDAIRNDERA